MGGLFLHQRLCLYPDIKHLAGSAIRLCGFRLGFGSRIRAYHPAFLCDRTKEIPRSLSVERHDGLSGFCRCIVHYCAGNDNYKHYLATGVSYPFVVVLCGLYRKKRLVEGVENKKIKISSYFFLLLPNRNHAISLRY